MKSTARLIVAIVATLVLSGAAIGGVVFAQTNSPSTTPTTPSTGGQSPTNGKAAARQGMMDDFLNQLAQNLGVSRSALDTALKTTANQQVDKAVSSGTLTQAQATAIKQRIANGQFPTGFGGFGGAPHGKAGAGVDLRGAVASALGVSTTELQQDLKNGQTIAQIAQAHGKTTQDVQNAVVASVKSSLDKAVQAGTLTQSQENSMLQRIQNGIQQGNGILGGRHSRGAGAKPAAAGASSQ